MVYSNTKSSPNSRGIFVKGDGIYGSGYGTVSKVSPGNIPEESYSPRLNNSRYTGDQSVNFNLTKTEISVQD